MHFSTYLVIWAPAHTQELHGHAGAAQGRVIRAARARTSGAGSPPTGASVARASGSVLSWVRRAVHLSMIEPGPIASGVGVAVPAPLKPVSSKPTGLVENPNR